MTLILLSVVMGAAALLYGAAKIRLFPQMFAQARTLGIRYPQFRLLGAFEVLLALLIVAGIWVEWLGATGALLLTFVMSVLVVLYARANAVMQSYIVPSMIGILAFILFLVHILA